jgi:hypothetical protein
MYVNSPLHAEWRFGAKEESEMGGKRIERKVNKQLFPYFKMKGSRYLKISTTNTILKTPGTCQE